jgi:hypothetical protein
MCGASFEGAARCLQGEAVWPHEIFSSEVAFGAHALEWEDPNNERTYDVDGRHDPTRGAKSDARVFHNYGPRINGESA